MKHMGLSGAIALIAGLVLGIAAASNLPRLSSPSGGAVGVIVLALLWVAFRAGRRSVKAEAIATAIAKAEATSVAAATSDSHATAQVLILNDGRRAEAAAERAAIGLDEAPWILAGVRRDDGEAVSDDVLDMLREEDAQTASE